MTLLVVVGIVIILVAILAGVAFMVLLLGLMRD